MKAIVPILACALALGCFAPVPEPVDAGAGAENSDAGTVDAGPLWPVEASQVEATESGGFPTPRCETDAGVVYGATYVLTLPDGRLRYSVCTGYVAPLRHWIGDFVLDAGQLTRFDDAMRALTRSDRKRWSADAPLLVLKLTTPQGTLRYEADYYSLDARPDTIYVLEPQPVFSLLQEFAGVSW